MNISGEKIRLRGRMPEDFARETTWREDDEEIREFDPYVGKVFNIQAFSITTLDGEHIGACSLYNHTPTEVQLGITIGDKDYRDKGYGTDAVNVLVGHAFVTLNAGRVWLKVLPANTRAIRCYEKCGFLCCGRLALDGYEFIMMERRREQ